MSSTTILQHATDALQAQAKLLWELECGASSLYDEVKSKANTCLEALSFQKAHLEGGTKDFESLQLKEEKMLELKWLTLMHVPSSVTAEVQKNFKLLVDQEMLGQSASVISITLLTCPWYELSQKERGEQAKHNILLVIFMFSDDQFFAPVNFQVKEKASVIDFGWFCAIEMSHFGQALCRGRTRYLEALYCREGAQIYASQDWLDLRLALSYQTVTGTHGFLEACLGQAIGGVGKKSKTGGMKLGENTTIFEICESFRLLQHAHNTLRLKSNYMEVTEEKLPDVAVASVTKIRSSYDHPKPLVCFQELFDLLMSWAGDLRATCSSRNLKSVKSNQAETEDVIGNWLLKTRLQGRTIRPCAVVSDSHTKLQELMEKIGGHVYSLKPEQILLVAVAGSAMYNLSTPSSDVDYLVIYTIPTETLISSTKKIPEIYESRGLDKMVEYGAYEARTFCEMLLKCSIVMLELLFAEDHEYMSPLWQELACQKEKFLSEKAISQYLGLIKNNFKFIERRKHSDSHKKDRKLFYQNFHKIHSVRCMMKGEVPPVSVSGDVRDFIMNVRTQDQGKWSRENILEELKVWYTDLRESLVQRTHRLRENPEYDVCANWLLSVRKQCLQNSESIMRHGSTENIPSVKD